MPQDCYVADVPIDEMLQKMLQDPELVESAFRPYLSEEGVWRDVRDGSVWKEHPLLSNNSEALGLILYAGSCTMRMQGSSTDLVCAQMISSLRIP